MEFLKRALSRLRESLTLQMVVAVVLAVFFGTCFPTLAEKPLFSAIGSAVIQLIKTFATPLLFAVVVHALVSSDIRSGSAWRMLRVAFTNGAVALGLGLVLSNAFQPGRFLSLPSVRSGDLESAPLTSSVTGVDAVKIVSSVIPKSVLEPFVENSVLGVVLLAVLIGLAVRRHRSSAVDDLLMTAVKSSEVLLSWIVKFAPLAVFAVTSRLVAEKGIAAFHGLTIYLTVGLLGFLIHVGVTYQFWIKGVMKRSLRGFWKEASEPVVYAFGANSSLATLPLTLRALKRLGVRDESAALGACVGTNLNNDGILLYEAMSVLMVAQSQGLDWDLLTQLGAAMVCMVAAMGVAGVPEAGFISLTVVVATVGLPTESLPVLLSVDWILARARSSVNVLSDIVVSMAIDHSESHSSSEAHS